MKKLFRRSAARRAAGEQVVLDEATGQVCDRACRSAAHRDRVRAAAYQARF
jgi:hypothetical protein